MRRLFRHPCAVTADRLIDDGMRYIDRFSRAELNQIAEVADILRKIATSSRT